VRHVIGEGMHPDAVGDVCSGNCPDRRPWTSWCPRSGQPAVDDDPVPFGHALWHIGLELERIYGQSFRMTIEPSAVL
jgi:hypothetical protein